MSPGTAAGVSRASTHTASDMRNCTGPQAKPCNSSNVTNVAAAYVAATMPACATRALREEDEVEGVADAALRAASTGEELLMIMLLVSTRLRRPRAMGNGQTASAGPNDANAWRTADANPFRPTPQSSIPKDGTSRSHILHSLFRERSGLPEIRSCNFSLSLC